MLINRFLLIALLLSPAWYGASPAAADGGVSYRDAADEAGIGYRRTPSLSKAIFDAIKNDPPFTFDRLGEIPMKAHGAPGVALLDFDLDGDLDIYVTNGPGTPNSLFANQFDETGETRFIDVATAAGVGAEEQDSTGVCYGDVDNDGDPDLLVVSHNAAPRLFENLADGTFADISIPSGITTGETRAASGCAMGDVDSDSLLDVVIGHTYDNWNHFRGINVEPFALNQHNRLWLNTGGNVFVDQSAASGIEELVGFPPQAPAGTAGLTWAVALVDLDLDGDVDLVTADDQGGISTFSVGERGFIRFFENDGLGRFTDVTDRAGLLRFGSWMGLAFGDLDCDGHLDIFGTNFGDFVPFALPEPGRQPSRWFLGQGDGTFLDPGVGDLVSTPFGWGNSILDYDNDGDQDIVYHGGLDLGAAVEMANFGLVLQNQDCSARFVHDAEALAGSTDHGLRTVHGFAVGDLDHNGFLDLVSVSNFDVPDDVELMDHTPLGTPFDARARFHLTFIPEPMSEELTWSGAVFENGTLAVELAEGNDNGWVEVRTLGTAGLTSRGRANRDGIGAVVRFWPLEDGGARRGVMRPITGGSSYASQHQPAAHFGLGAAERGLVEVLWPGGVKNRLYNVRRGERIVFPEIPCGFDDDSLTFRQYLGCVLDSLDDLVAAGVLRSGERVRFLMSALRASGANAGGRLCEITGELDGMTEKLVEKELAALLAEGGVTYRDVAAEAGVTYLRTPSASKAKYDAIKEDPPYDSEKQNETPMKSRGAPGVALIDFDRDGDLDLYVTNGPGTPNSLYASQLRESGDFTLIDVAEAAGVAATEQDSTGVCFGDTDNDGDPELLVLSHDSPPRFYENGGDGTFIERSAEAGFTALGVHVSTGCSMGDVDGDGLLDVAIANAYDNWSHFRGINSERFALNQHNLLLHNLGGNVFADVSAEAGIRELAGLPPEAEGAAGLTWALALVDHDLDGDLDLINADDQAGFPTAAEGGVDRGLLRFFQNDGSGRFTDRTLELGGVPGAWMGLAFGDWNCDGHLDLFATNFGDYVPGPPPRPGRQASRWFLGRADGGFDDPGVGPLLTTPFGFGASSLDYDNDGDLDLYFDGGMDIGPGIEASNMGTLLRNPGCSAAFEWDRAAVAASEIRRIVQGVATGDLDQDGFVDVVTVANADFPPEVGLTAHQALGSPFDAVAAFHLNFEPDANGDLVWMGSTFDDGTLAIELAAEREPATADNGWVEVRTMGSVGLTRGGRANRDGIGAVVRVYSAAVPAPGVARPVLGGASYASQDALAVHLGIGDAERAIVDVLWPGGVRNRLYNVAPGERLTFHEIPCGFDDETLTARGYLACVLDTLDDLVHAGVMRPGESPRYLISALRARRSVQGPACQDATR